MKNVFSKFVLAILLALFWVSTALSQAETEIAQDDIEALVARANSLAITADGVRDDELYYATLAHGLENLMRRNTKGTRGVNKSENFEPFAMPVAQPVPGAYAKPEHQDGIESRLNALRDGGAGVRIIGGDPVDAGELTETVAIVEDESGTLCTGTLVSEDAVLTAAHCVCDMDILPAGGGSAQVIFGNPNINTLTESPKVSPIDNSRTRLQSLTFCSDMQARTTCGRDLALVYFEASDCVDCAHRARLVDENEGNESRSDMTALIAGYGATQPGSRQMYKPRRVGDGASPPKMFASIFAPRLCTALYQGHKCQPGVRETGCRVKEDLVTPLTGGKDTCYGDSGGPMFRIEDAQLPNGMLVEIQTLIGVTSRALYPTQGCGSGGVYTSVFSENARNFLSGAGLE